ncbi:MAG: fatty acid--CoA ligase family protein [Lachnospiraceae bacterium]|nr:fatty acid--CoA ligase family protein [Lachnospiraceae bacterium]
MNYSLVDGMLAPLAFGFQLVLVPKYEPDKFDEYVKKYSFNHLMASISAYYEPLPNNKKLAEMDLSCLGHLYYGGEKMNAETEKAVNEFLMNRGARFPLAKGLGSTEMTSTVTVTYEEINLPDSSGIPLVNNLCKIVDPETNEEKPYNEIGEICMSGPSLMIGYYQKDEETDRIIKVHADGRRWLHTGDLGRINEDGAVFITGRIKRIVMTRGSDGNPTKMFPDRVEDVIYTCQTVGL